MRTYEAIHPHILHATVRTPSKNLFLRRLSSHEVLLKHILLLSSVSICLTILFYASSVFADEYDYHPSLALYLGAGYNPENLRDRFLSCLDVKEETHLDTEGSYNSGVYTKFIKSRSELMKEVGISARVAAQGFFGQVKSGVEYLDQISFHEDSLTFLISAKETYGRKGIKNQTLKPFAQALLDAGKYAEFAKRCGTHYVDQVLKGSSLFAIYTVRNISEEHNHKLKIMLSASANYGFLSASLESQFKKSIEEFAQTSQTEFQIYTLGGNGLRELANIPKYITDIDNIKNIVSQYLKTMTRANSVPLTYYTGTMANFGWQEESHFDSAFRDRVLEQYYYWLTDLKHTMDRLDTILKQQDSVFTFLSADEIRDFEDAYNERAQYTKVLTSEANACYKASDRCSLPEYNRKLKRIKWPQAPDQCENHRLLVHQYGLLTADQIVQLRVSKEVPILTPSKKFIISYISCADFIEN